LFSHWHPTMFLAQAIAARSYAMHKIQIGRRGDFDLEATTASQVYGGWTQNARALEAVDTTRGLVLTYGQEVLPAYYSSCCGGTSQDASLAFPDGDDAATTWRLVRGQPLPSMGAAGAPHIDARAAHRPLGPGPRPPCGSLAIAFTDPRRAAQQRGATFPTRDPRPARPDVRYPI